MIKGVSIKNEDCQDMIKYIEKYGVGSYDFCWCGSDKKFKFCCQKKEKNISTHKELNDLKKLYKVAYIKARSVDDYKGRNCLIPTCKYRANRNHAVTNNGVLSKIDTERLVRFDIFQKKKKVYASRNKATTYYGLCTDHDTAFFKILENGSSITYSKEQKYAYVYRSFLANYINELTVADTTFKEWFKSNPEIFTKQHSYQKYGAGWVLGKFRAISQYKNHEHKINKLKNITERLTSNFDLATNKWNIQDDFLVFSNVVTINVINPYFVFQALVIAISDLYDNELTIKQSLYENDTLLDYCSVTLLPNIEQFSIDVFIAWDKQCNSSMLEHIKNLFSNNDKAAIVNYLNNAILACYSDFFFSEKMYYNRLNEETKKAIEHLLSSSCNLGINQSNWYEYATKEAKIKFIELDNTP